MSEYYAPSGSPSTGATGASSAIRAEFTAISAGFALLPTMLGNGDLPVFVNTGGTALTTVSAASARTKLGLAIGSNVQAWDADLDALAALDATVGLLIKTAAATYAQRSVIGTANEIAVTNGNGVAGNVTVSLPAALTFTGKTVTGGTFNNSSVTSAVIVSTGNAQVTGGALNNVAITNLTSPLAIASGGTASASARAAAAALGVPFILAKSAVAVSCPADTNEDTLATITLPANAMGANGRIRVIANFTVTNNGNNKTPRIKFGGTAYYSAASSGLSYQSVEVWVANRNATNSQVGQGTFEATGTYSDQGYVTSAVDTTGSVTILITGQKASAGDTMTLESFVIELLADGT